MFILMGTKDLRHPIDVSTYQCLPQLAPGPPATWRLRKRSPTCCECQRHPPLPTRGVAPCAVGAWGRFTEGLVIDSVLIVVNSGLS